MIGGDVQRNANKITYPFLVSFIVLIHFQRRIQLKLGAKIHVEHISSEEANDYDTYLFAQFERLHQKLYLSDKGKLKTLFFMNKLVVLF